MEGEEYPVFRNWEESTNSCKFRECGPIKRIGAGGGKQRKTRLEKGANWLRPCKLLQELELHAVKGSCSLFLRGRACEWEGKTSFTQS